MKTGSCFEATKSTRGFFPGGLTGVVCVACCVAWGFQSVASGQPALLASGQPALLASGQPALLASGLAVSERFPKQDEATQDEAKAEDGTADFEKAAALKVNARRPFDFDQVVQLCESAIKKGLDPASEEFCRRLLLDSLLEYGRMSAARVLVPNRDARWRFLRGEALKRLVRAVEIAPDSAEAWMLIAKLNVLENGDRTQGLEAVEKVIDLSATNKSQLAEALLVRAGFAETDEERIEDLNQAVEVDPSNLEARRARAMYFLLSEKADDAMVDFEALLELAPEDINNRLMLAEVLIQTEKLDRALELLEGAQAPATDFRAKLLMAQVYFTKKDYEKSLQFAEQVVSVARDNIPAINLQILSLLQLERHEEALSACQDLVSRAPGLPQAYWLRSIALSSLERYDDAIKDLRVLVDNVPENLLFKLQLGNLYNASERPRRALKLFDEIFEENPDFDGLYRARGDAYLSAGQHAEAVADYEKELVKSPEDSGTLNNLAWVLATSPNDEVRNGARALELGLKAAELTKHEKAHILSTLASGYAETGDFEKARQWIAKAVEIAEREQASNVDSLKKEAASYDKNEPWREMDIKEDVPLDDEAPRRPSRQRQLQEDDDDF